MCGIAGFLDLSADRSTTQMERALRGMTRALAHRGPDGDGHWVDAQSGIALGHRRLSIVDLTVAGSQPMWSANRRFALVYNGEIYNAEQLRAQLDAEHPHAWRGHSDTEVLLEAFSTWGVARTLERALGMFAIALWDCSERKLTLARDRAGEKPLFYGWCGSVLLFASELKAMQVHPRWIGKLDSTSVYQVVQFSYVPAPHSIYSGISKLPPAAFATFPAMSTTVGAMPAPVEYWSFPRIAEEGSRNRFRGSPKDAIDGLREHIATAIKGQMVADVPVGAFLSGGVDSSLVVAMMQEQSTRPVLTFSIGYSEDRYNEAPFAAAVSRHLGTEHTELIVGPKDVLDIIPSLPAIYDEPLADSSQMPTYLVCKLARQRVTVSLSGDAGDELFAGYNHFVQVDELWRRIRNLPSGARRLSGAMIKLAPIALWDRLLPVSRGLNGDRMHKAAELLSTDTLLGLYRAYSMRWYADAAMRGDRLTWPTLPQPHLENASPMETLMACDFRTYMPDSILAKLDRAAMAVSLETRIPLLDPRVVEYAWTIPMSLKRVDGRGKWLLRQLLYRYVPAELIDRPKTGFAVPIKEWLRGPLRDWAESLLSERSLKDGGVLAVAPIRKRWREHLEGHRDWSASLWNVLMFEAWRVQVDQAAASPAVA